jgi:tricorn protease
VENEGVAPDIEVVLDPIASNQGRDTQLERAISEVLSQLEDFESPIPAVAPALPTELGK